MYRPDFSIFRNTTTTAFGATKLHWIEDFAPGEDKILLEGFNYGTPDFIGSAAFSGKVGEVRAEAGIGKTTITIDDDGGGDADYALELKGSLTLSDSDILFT